MKDTGNILPGHGGILDRIDGILFALPSGIILINYFFNEKKIAILGSTGSIGENTLKIIDRDKKILKLNYCQLIKI